jgi:K+ transporter
MARASRPEQALMAAATAVDEHRTASRFMQPTTPSAALTALGIVCGDLGTSPLYVLAMP